MDIFRPIQRCELVAKISDKFPPSRRPVNVALIHTRGTL